MTTKRIEDSKLILKSYIDLMEELKERHAVIRAVLANATQWQHVLSPFAFVELCYLQLRMICELIALGCLLVHGDIGDTRTRRMRKEYKADWIIRRLTKLHPSFYPVPTDQILDQNGAVTSTVPIAKEYLTKEKLLKLYAECGSVLHRGNLEEILSPDPRKLDSGRVAMWATEITNLLTITKSLS